jgi:phenylalanyl-tRNA synthetase beta chain
MKLPFSWLSQYVDVHDIDPKTYNEKMTMSGSKVEEMIDTGAEIQNVVVGKIMDMVRHPNSDHMWICQIDVGDEITQIVTGAWNIHEGDLIPVAKHNSYLPGGIKITKGKLRGEKSNGMLCSKKELNVGDGMFSYATIKAAAILGDYTCLKGEEPSLPETLTPGFKIYGKVHGGLVKDVTTTDYNQYRLIVDMGKEDLTITTDCSNIHADDYIAVDTAAQQVCTLADLHAQQAEFPHCIEDGIFILNEDCKPGDDIKDVLGLNDIIADFEITSNRPDCLSIIGLARETAVTFDRPLHVEEPVVKGSGDNIENYLKVTVEEPTLCPRYTAKIVKNIKIEPSPAWMQHRLHAAGVRPINNIVDITNYVMLEYGQPMHAFDYACLSDGQIVVRRPKPEESIETLDGQARAITPNMLAICDGSKPVAVAGVMGGANSEITYATQTVVFESACFHGPTVRITAKELGMRTEASGRFEKGLNAGLTMPALLRACQLVEELGAGEVIDGIVDVDHSDKTPNALPFEPDKMNHLLGIHLSAEEQIKILEKLEFKVENGMVIAPYFRIDIARMCDVAEEIARIYGYDNIPTTLYAGATVQGSYTPEQQFERTLGSLSRAMGYDEIMTHSFFGSKMYDAIGLAEDDPHRISVTITNPLGEDMSIMRTTALPSMLDTLAHNNNHKNACANLYEIATTYIPAVDENGNADVQHLPDEKKVLMLGTYGNQDFFTFKGHLEAIFKNTDVQNVRFEAETNNPSYHPGRCAKIYADDELIGIFGSIHPTIAANFGFNTEVLVAQLYVHTMFAHTVSGKIYEPLPKFPASSRDIAILCDDSIPVSDLEGTIRQAVGSILENITLFDVYRGDQIPAGKKSVAYSMTLRAKERTLTDEECDQAVSHALADLEKNFHAVLRS